MKKILLILIALLLAIPSYSLAQCVDSDKGVNILILGITSNNSYTLVDSCDDNTHANDAICNNGAVEFRQSIACKGGDRCRNGKCVNDAQLFDSSCADTDGNDYFQFGIVTVGEDVLIRDSCTGDTLTEAYCRNNVAWTENNVCDNGCSGGKCLPAPGEEDDGGRRIYNLPEEAMPHCEATSLFWTDGFSNSLSEAGIGLPVYGYITGEGCEGARVSLNVLDSSDGSLVEDLGTLDFAADDGSWYAFEEWVPGSVGNYYLFATVLEAVPGLSYTLDNFDSPLQVLDDCAPESLPDGESCGIDPVTNEPLVSGTDSDCDGVDDCMDQWVYNYGGDVDSVGAPLDEDEEMAGIRGCLDQWDCTNAEWSECLKNPEGRLTRTRNINLCILPPGNVCPYRPSQEKLCLKEEKFPVFGWANALLVSLLLAGYYFIKRA